MHRLQSLLDGFPSLKRHKSAKRDGYKQNIEPTSWLHRHRRKDNDSILVPTQWQYASQRSHAPVPQLSEPDETLIISITETHAEDCYTRLPAGGDLPRSRRSLIKTNPYLSNRSHQRPSCCDHLPLPKGTFDKENNNYQRQQLSESICSSGYASHDSSPESSMNTSQWSALFENHQSHVAGTMDKSVGTRDSLLPESPCSSYIDEEDEDGDYDDCYGGFVSALEELEAIERRLKRTTPPVFHAPPPPPLESPRKVSQDARSVLVELNSRMIALQQKSEALQQLQFRHTHRLQRVTDTAVPPTPQPLRTTRFQMAL